MGGLDFKSDAPREREDAALVAYNTKIALWLFLVYVLFYAGFMALSAFWPTVIGSPFMGGVNLSIIYGFALIAAAMLLALLYMKMSRKPSVGGTK
jgi:uncharacterized membrane protein (DUF485 family)